MRTIELTKKITVNIPDTLKECNETGCVECAYSGNLRFNRALCPHKEVLKAQPKPDIFEETYELV